MDAEQPHVIYQRQGHVAQIILNRPEKLNAISTQMLADLHRCLDTLQADADARVAILRGAGRGFCVGFDLGAGSKAFRPKDMGPWQDRERLRHTLQLFHRLWECPKPIIAQVHGYCLAGGVVFPLFADITIIAEECRLGWPKLPLGGGFVAPLFARAVGPGRAKMMEFVVGSEITGKLAADWGYAAQAVPEAVLAETVLALAGNIAKLPSSLLHLRKSAVNRVFDQAGLQQTLAACAEWDALAHEDPGVAEVRGWVREDGMKAAIARFQREGL